MARARIDADTTTCARSYETALLAAGGLIELVDAVPTRACHHGFAFVRPPGHHATAAQAMGFCLFNNVAVAAKHLQLAHGYERIAIVDWDLHHGNGTQAIFYDDPSVLYVSLHQFPFYPGTGALTDTGRGDGLGFNVNVPFSAGVGDEGYRSPSRRSWRRCCGSSPRSSSWSRPGSTATARSAGRHAGHREGLSRHDAPAPRDRRRGRRRTPGRVLEGGYDLDAIRGSTEAVLTELSHGARQHEHGTGRTAAFDRLREVLRPHWRV